MLNEIADARERAPMVSRDLINELATGADRSQLLALGGKLEHRTSLIRAFSALVPLAVAELREQRVFLVISLSYVAVVIGVSHAIGRPQAVSVSLYSPVILVFIYLLLLGCLSCVVLRPERRMRRFVEHWGRRFQVPQRVIAALPVLLVLPLFTSAFTSMKVLIPVVNPFSWDPTFASWDRWIHGGIEPWRLLHPALGYPGVTAALNFIYYKWFFVLNAVLVWQAFTLRNGRLRQQFFLAFALTWIVLGTVMALLVPAAGPCYYGRVTGLEDPYRPLMAYLADVHGHGLNTAFAVQEWLWGRYGSGDLVPGAGISAMPSLHVAMAVLFALVGFQRSRALGGVLALFALAILLGSVHLAWHYAIDGYAAIAGVLVIWWFAGRIAFAGQTRAGRHDG